MVFFSPSGVAVCGLSMLNASCQKHVKLCVDAPFTSLAPPPGLSPQMDTIDQINGLNRFEEVPHEVSDSQGASTSCIV